MLGRWMLDFGCCNWMGFLSERVDALKRQWFPLGFSVTPLSSASYFFGHLYAILAFRPGACGALGKRAAAAAAANDNYIVGGHCKSGPRGVASGGIKRKASEGKAHLT